MSRRLSLALLALLAARAYALDVVGAWRVVYSFTAGSGGIVLVEGDTPLVRPLLGVGFSSDGTGLLVAVGVAPRRFFWEIAAADPVYNRPEHVRANVQGSGEVEWFFNDLPDGRRMWTLIQKSIWEQYLGVDVQVYAVIEAAD